MSNKINTSRFYAEWKGHPLQDITTFRSIVLERRPNKPIIYLAGDSSLDNKAWVPSSGSRGEQLPVDVPDIYKAALDRAAPKPDVAFWLNHLLGDSSTTLNLAVEESTLRERSHQLLDHDRFIRDNIRATDVLIVSVGANDIALRPTFATVRNMLQLAWLTPRAALERGLAWGLGHFIRLFKDEIEAYISKIVEKQKPRAVVICMIYYPLEANASDQSSWADLPLRLLGYNSYPGQLQTAIRKMYELATQKIQVQGTTVIPCALFEAMDGKSKEDYSARVEPSSEGGRKMAEHLTKLLDPLINDEGQKGEN